MSDDLIKRSDAIEVAYQLRRKPNDEEWDWWLRSFNAIPSADRPQVNPDLVKDFLKRQYEATLEENKRLIVGKWQAEQVLQTIIQQLEYVLEHGAVDEDGTHPITVENVLACIRAWMKGTDNETAND